MFTQEFTPCSHSGPWGPRKAGRIRDSFCPLHIWGSWDSDILVGSLSATDSSPQVQGYQPHSGLQMGRHTHHSSPSKWGPCVNIRARVSRLLSEITYSSSLKFNILVFKIFQAASRCGIYTVEYDASAIKKNETSPSVATWMDLEDIMLSEMSDRER